ncbi:hypothetical protein BJ508DRAFT_335801 [Ascobolus immersus RN42]|uniref:Uncharacterized protein n=1 Tax=Ascobolus immersus RN42 TaxID=1160509 RepID=A0A3N4HB53_ASCIM|nr:hypothetical protein BJ508DRAFT_335801 [Ascobolus immersus RN42]
MADTTSSSTGNTSAAPPVDHLAPALPTLPPMYYECQGSTTSDPVKGFFLQHHEIFGGDKPTDAQRAQPHPTDCLNFINGKCAFVGVARDEALAGQVPPQRASDAEASVVADKGISSIYCKVCKQEQMRICAFCQNRKWDTGVNGPVYEGPDADKPELFDLNAAHPCPGVEQAMVGHDHEPVVF